MCRDYKSPTTPEEVVMKKNPLLVTLHVREPSTVELTVGDNVQLDRLVRSPRGYLPERHGRLLAPGATTLPLAEGFYVFRTLSDAHLKVIHGGVGVAEMQDNKDGYPQQPPPLAPGDAPPTPSGRGDEPVGERGGVHV
jgi:hypothetical protein